MKNPALIVLPPVAVLGAGRLAWRLIPALQAAGYPVLQLIARNAAQRARYAEAFGIGGQAEAPAALDPSARLVLLALPDDALPPVAAALAPAAQPEQVFIHLSGSAPLAALQALGDRIGVMYPLYQFTPGGGELDFAQIPLFTEGSPAAEVQVAALARRLSRRVFQMDSAARLRLHLGAVFACNFSNLLFRIAGRYAPEGIRSYEPLIRNYMERMFELGPEHTQTGPAIRGDRNTLQRHLELLADEPELQALYRLMSELIAPELREGAGGTERIS